MKHTPGVDELDCVDVREALFAGRPLSAAEAEHAATCPICSQAPGGGEALEPPLFAELEDAVRRERGFTAWLRSLPTPVRFFAAIDSAAVFILAMVLARPRWAFGPMPLFRVVPVVAVLAAELGVVLWLALRPLQAAPPNRKLVLGSIFAGLLVPVVFAMLPPDAPAVAAPTASEMTTAMVACFLFGAVPGGLLVFALRALDRNGHGGTDVSVLAAVGGGLAGNAALELHCPSAAPVHLLLGHATLGIALVVLYGVVRRTARPSAQVKSP